MNEERIMTLHPQGKKGVNILKWKYNAIKTQILTLLKEHGEMSYSDLSDKMIDTMQDTFDGKVIWYTVSVKLDLEARNIIERIPKTSPHRLRIRN